MHFYLKYLKTMSNCQRHGGIIKEDQHGGGRPLRKRLTYIYCILLHATYLPTAVVTGHNYLLLSTDFLHNDTSMVICSRKSLVIENGRDISIGLPHN